MTMLSSNNHRSISALLKLTSVVRYLNRGLKNEIRISQSDPVSTHEVKNYLSEHGLPYKTGHACITTICPKYRKSKLKLKEVDQLFINSTSGYFVCRSCQKSGPWGKLKDNIGALAYGNIKNAAKVVCFEKWNEVEPIKQESESVSKLLAECSESSTYDEDSLLKILEEYGLEEISTETLQSFGIKFLPDGEGIVLPACDAEMNFVMAKTLTKNETSGKLKTKTIPRRDYVGLFGMNLTKDKHNIVICGSEADAMAVYQSTGVPAVSLPRGITTLPQEVLPYLESFKKITIWFDNSILSFANAKLFAKKLGVNRTQVIRPERDCPGPHEALKSKLKLKKILAKAASIQHTHIISFSDLRDDVKNELTCSAEVAGVRWKNFSRLNDILKGHRRSELTVFTGGTGTGKTTFMSDYSLDLCTSGVNTLWGSFEINNVRLMKMMLQQYSRKDLAKHIDEYDQIADQFEALPMYFMNFHGQERIKKVIETMSHAVYVYDISHVIVDNLQFMMGAGDSHMDKFTKQDQIIAAFRTFATNMQCHVSLVIHPRKENEEMLTTNSIFGSAKASQEADNIIILQAMKVNGIRKKYLQVTKNRFDGTLGNMGLRFDKESKSFSVLPQQRELTGQSHLSSSDPPRILTSTHDNRPCEHNEACGNDSFTW